MAEKYRRMSFLTLGRGAVSGQACLMTTEQQNVPACVWSAVQDAPVRELFPGIRLRPLWTGDNGAQAHVLEMDPNTRWQGVDVHQPGPEEVFVVTGIFNDGDRDYPAGSFIHAPRVPRTSRRQRRAAPCSFSTPKARSP